MKKSGVSIPRALSLAAAFTLLLAVPRGMPIFYESLVEIISFLLILVCAVLYFKRGITEISLVMFILAIFYNPLFLVIHNIYRAPFLDIATSLFFFIVVIAEHRLLQMPGKS